jgi:diphthamide synthase (EF-2-diphthine--ammonia ligase)
MKSSKADELVQVIQQEDGVELIFSNNIPKEVLKAQVESCKAETCTCCTPVFRKNVKSFIAKESEDGMKVMIKGDITADEVKRNVLNCAPKLADT